MIPKIIHYCWFGGNQMTPIINECIRSWKLTSPEWTIIEWNESNFDVTQNDFVKTAYDNKAWAFVSDFARLQIIYDNGGVYLDTDVFLKQNLNALLSYDAFFMCDDIKYIATGLGFGADKHHPIVKSLADKYKTYKFPCGTNTTRDTVCFMHLFPNWYKTSYDQILDCNILIIGYKNVGKYLKHLYTKSSTIHENLNMNINVIYHHPSYLEKLSWNFKCFCRCPILVNFFEKHNLGIINKTYWFLAYDFLEMGTITGIKFFLSTIYKKIRKC